MDKKEKSIKADKSINATGKSYDVEIFRLASDSTGVGYIEGKTVFVSGMLPGERGKVRITEDRNNYLRADTIEIHCISQERQSPPCTIYSECGGCNLQHLNYKASLDWKRRWVEDALRRIGGLADIQVEPIMGMEDPWRYRNKATLHRDKNGKFGYYKGKTKEVIAFDDCLLLSAYTNRKIKKFQGIIGEKSPGIKTATFRESNRGKGLIILDGNTADKKELEKVIRELKNNEDFSPLGYSIAVPENNSEFEGSGAMFLNEHLDGLRFRVSPRAFLQVNPRQTQKLYSLVRGWAALTGQETVWDLYCGIGTMTMMLAGKSKNVIGIEENPHAVQDAEENAKDNKIYNVRFVQGRVEDLIIKELHGTPDLVVTDPPRAGMELKVLEGLLKIRPKRIIYVSCNPATMARDLKVLTMGEEGEDLRGAYEIKKVQPVDMFPWTEHVECIIMMTKCGLEGKR